MMDLAFPLSGCCDTVPNSLEQIMKAPNGNFGVIVAEDKHRMLLASILFQMAVSVNNNVYFIMKNPFDQPPYKVHGMPEHHFVNYTMIQCIYPKDFMQLSMFLTVLGGQKDEKLPKIVVLEDLDSFLAAENKSEKIQQKSKILTLLRNLRCQTMVSVQDDKYFPTSKLHLLADEVWKFQKFTLSTTLHDGSQILIDYTTRRDLILLKQIRHEYFKPVPNSK